jgi:putative endonuclease
LTLKPAAAASPPASTTATNATKTNWFVYLIRTAKGQLYTGISTDPARRLRQHQGELTGGAKALRGKGPLQLVWQVQAPNRAVASQWEYQFKQLSKSQKELVLQQRWQPDFLHTESTASAFTNTSTDKTSASTEVA